MQGKVKAHIGFLMSALQDFASWLRTTCLLSHQGGGGALKSLRVFVTAGTLFCLLPPIGHKLTIRTPWIIDRVMLCVILFSFLQLFHHLRDSMYSKSLIVDDQQPHTYFIYL